MFFVTGDVGAIGELVALFVKGKRERLAPRLYTLKTETVRNRRLSHNSATHRHTELKPFYTVSYFITLNQTGIFKWE